MAETSTIRYEIDFKKMVENAEAAGFNPLTVLRNGAASGFAVEHHPIVPMGSFTSGGYAQDYIGEYGGGEFTSESYNYGGGGGDSGFSYPGASFWDEPLAGMITAADGSTRPIVTRPAMESVWDNTSSVMITGPSGAAIRITGSGAPSGRVSASSSAGGSDGKAKPGFQAQQAYEKSKIANIVTGDVEHYILPGVSFIEQGGVTRAQTMEDGYGEDGPAATLMIPKLLNDIGFNTQRLLSWLGMPSLYGLTGKNAAGWLEQLARPPGQQGPMAAPVPSASMAAPPELQSVSGGVYDVWGNGGGGDSYSPYRETASYSASKSVAKASTGQSYSQSPSKAESKAQSSYNESKAESKAQSAKAESKSSSSGSSGGKKK